MSAAAQYICRTGSSLRQPLRWRSRAHLQQQQRCAHVIQHTWRHLLTGRQCGTTCSRVRTALHLSGQSAAADSRMNAATAACICMFADVLCLCPAAVMRVFAKEGSFPTLVHCAHGKDRTGVIIMLLLLICDAPHEAIVQDYVQVGRQS